MSITMFQVEVKIKGTPFEYYSRYGKYISHEIIKMFHFERNSPQQAIQAGKRYGQVISCCKVQVEDSLNSIEKMELEEMPVFGANNPYKSAMAMDEMVWKKRNKRRENIIKDKDAIDKGGNI